MKQNYMKVRAFLEQQFPELEGKIHGSNYPPPPMAELVGNIISMFQLFGMAWIIFGGEKILSFFGFSEPPRFYYVIQENGFQFGLLLFVFIPQIVSRFMVTGAFEIYLDKENLVFSRLQTGAFPTVNDLVTPLTNAGLQVIQQNTQQQ